MNQSITRDLTRIASDLAKSVDQLCFAEPVTHVYNPLVYAWKSHQEYLSFANDNLEALFLGMNPGPWGMAQTGVPFGEIAAVRDWMQIQCPVDKPPNEHEKRPIDGFACQRSEVSGRRLWGLFAERYVTAEAFFQSHFVVNYCPLVFMEQSARNRTPDKLPANEREPLTAVCDNHLLAVLQLLKPTFLVAVGVYAEACFKRVVQLGNFDATIVRILHPSPASPAANKDWAGQVTKQLVNAGLWKS